MTELTPSEQAYFDTGGKADPEAPVVAKEGADAKTELPATERKEETPAASPAANSESEAKPAADVAEPRKGEVPHEALHAAREATKAAKAEAAQAKAQALANADRLASLEARLQPQPANEAPLTLEQRLERQEQYRVQEAQQATHRAQKAQFVNRYAADAQAFAKETPDFWDAYNHAVTVRRAMWEDAGITDPNEVNALLEQEEAAIVNRAMASGKSGPEALYSIAKRFGYIAKAPMAPGPSPEQAAAQAAAERTAKATETAAAQLRMLAEGQKHEKSLANAPSAGDVDPSAEELLKLSDEEFEKMTRGKKWKKYGGG